VASGPGWFTAGVLPAHLDGQREPVNADRAAGGRRYPPGLGRPRRI